MTDVPKWMNLTLNGISVKTVLLAIAIFLASYYALRLAKYIFMRTERYIRTSPAVHATLQRSFESLGRWYFLIVALYAAVCQFSLPKENRTAANFAISAATMVQILLVLGIWIRYMFYETGFAKSREGRIRSINMSLASAAVIGAWFLGILLLLDNFGFNVTTIIAGLGVGGIAVGLALQSVLGDVIASFCIGLDEPFEVGDFIDLGEYKGAVESVGLKTTKIRSVNGELLVLSNNDIVNSRIRNFKRMQERRVVFRIGVVYSTTYEKLVEIPRLLRTIVEGMEKIRFDRAHFIQLGDSALNYEVVYFVLSPDYLEHMNIQEAINLKIFEEFARRKIEFAFPTRTIILDGGVPSLS
ncbi:MAG: mechanosensitive ion channel family protein [Oligoflexales bacterium]